jgi:hypothetical protein
MMMSEYHDKIHVLHFENSVVRSREPSHVLDRKKVNRYPSGLHGIGNAFLGASCWVHVASLSLVGTQVDGLILMVFFCRSWSSGCLDANHLETIPNPRFRHASGRIVFGEHLLFDGMR